MTVASVDWSGTVTDAVSTVTTFLPRLLLFAVILVVGFLIAKALLKLTDRVLERVGFDRAVERGGIARAMAGSRYDASDIAAKLVYYAVVLITLQVAFGVFGSNPVSDLLTQIVAWLPQAFAAIVIVVVAAAIAKAVKDIVSGTLSGLSYGGALGTAAAAFVIGFGVIAALNQIGVAVVVTSSVLIAVLATLGGILVVGVGGGLVAPMSRRWEGWLDRASDEAGTARDQARANATSGRSRSGDARDRRTDAYADETVDLRAADPAGSGSSSTARSGGDGRR